MTNIGFNVYYWGHKEQQHLLKDGLGQWAKEARERGWLRRLWFCPYDARSPHVFAIFSAADTNGNEVRHYLQDRIQSFIAQNPSQAQLTSQEISDRHRGCRGRTMNSADREAGPALNNSFRIFEHAPSDYPFWLSSRVRDADEFWERLDLVCFWALEQAGGDVTRAAIRWLAAVDRSLAKQNVARADYWRYHAGSLLLGLEESVRKQQYPVAEWLHKAVPERNRQVLSALWSESENRPPLDVDGLVHLILSHSGSTLEQKFSVLRSVNHFAFLQLGQIGLQEIPIILYAWQRNL